MTCPSCVKAEYDTVIEQEEAEKKFEMRYVGTTSFTDLCGSGCCTSEIKLFQCRFCGKVEVGQ